MEESTVDLKTAGAAALEYVKSHVPERTAPVCGNSIGVDRRFLDQYLPELDQYLHYRSIDVSSIKELCRRWYPAIYKKRPAKQETHRALDDIRESIEELRYYREAMFVPSPAAATPQPAPPEPA
jgi:oligoribonuclease